MTPRIYGSPKIHKPEVPLRPIVSFVTSPSYQLSKYLADILSPLVDRTPSHVKDSNEFVAFIGSQVLDDEMMVSFDVVSLFTNVPIDLAIKVAKSYLLEDDTLEDHTLLSVDEIISLLELCLNATYLQFRGSYYRQIHGTAMGSPVSVVVANLIMEDVEQRALVTFPGEKPRFWKRYVDDTFTAIRPSLLQEFHDHLNSIVGSIQFTYEVEENGC